MHPGDDEARREDDDDGDDDATEALAVAPLPSLAAAPAPALPLPPLAGGCDAVKVVVRLRPSSSSENNGTASASSSEAGNPRGAVPHSHRRPPPCITQAGAASVAFADGSGFSYDAVAGASTDQEALFAAAGSPIVDAVLQGYNGCVIAYGQTGSGKTHTMLGSLSRDPAEREQRGLAPRAFEALFERALAEAGGGRGGGGAPSSSQQQQQCPLRVSLSFVEIYNETITDLLSAASNGGGSSSAHANEGGENNNPSLHLREEKGRGVFVDGATVLPVADAAAAISLLARGAAARRSAETRANASSSRSHAVCVALVERVAKGKAGSSSSSAAAATAAATKTIARLTLVDLAGSERQAHTGAAGERLKEAAAINKSLSALGNVVAALAENSERTAAAMTATAAETGANASAAANAAASAAAAAAIAAPGTIAAANNKPLRHVPYRDSRLTFLLQDSLGGNSRTVLVATVSADASCAGETMSTLRFAARARRVACRAVINPVVAPGGGAGGGSRGAGGGGGGDRRAEAALAAEVAALRAELAALKSAAAAVNAAAAAAPASTRGASPAMMMIDGAFDGDDGGSPLVGGGAGGESSRRCSSSTSMMLIPNPASSSASTSVAVLAALRREAAALDACAAANRELSATRELVRRCEADNHRVRMVLKLREDRLARVERSLAKAAKKVDGDNGETSSPSASSS